VIEAALGEQALGGGQDASPGGDVIRHVLRSDLAVEREPVGHDHIVG
jgi:hypothetical protein